MAGFISGGRLGSLPVWMADSVVSTVLVCAVNHCQPLCPATVQCPLGRAYLAILQREDQRHFVSRNLLVRHLRGNPALGGIGLPRPGADVVDVCHGGWLWSCFLPLQMAVRNQGPKAASLVVDSTLSSLIRCGRWLLRGRCRGRRQRGISLQSQGSMHP